MADSMTPRQRLLTALNHARPDRVPIDLGGVVTGIHRFAYDRLKDALGIAEPTEIMDFKQQLAQPSEELLTRLGVDTRYVSTGSRSGAGLEIREDQDSYNYTDDWGIEWKMPKANALYFDMVSHPLAGLSAADLDHYDWPEQYTAAGVADLEQSARDLHENTDYAVVFFGSASFFEFAWYLRGFENYLMDLVTDEVFVNKFLDKLLELHLSAWEAYLPAAGQYLDIVQLADDFGHQGGPMMSLGIFDKFIKPRQKEVISFVKARTEARIFFHTCGSVRQFIPSLIENGVDALNPVQVGAADMDPAELKAEFGDRISFWGGIDTQQVLPYGTPEQVAAETKRILEVLGAGGGYVLNSVHNIQADVPADNIIAMFDTARQYRY